MGFSQVSEFPHRKLPNLVQSEAAITSASATAQQTKLRSLARTVLRVVELAGAPAAAVVGRSRKRTVQDRGWTWDLNSGQFFPQRGTAKSAQTRCLPTFVRHSFSGETQGGHRVVLERSRTTGRTAEAGEGRPRIAQSTTARSKLANPDRCTSSRAMRLLATDAALRGASNGAA